jgi:LIVCS family branched-chain amino acid:cation transporter
MNTKFLFVSTGFALFAMFFGSGNLVFPLLVGIESQGHYLISSLGIIFTGVLVPFLGVFAMLLYKGETHEFLGTMGGFAKFWFPLIALSLMGPFGVLARCITVAHGSFTLLFPDCSLIVFSLAFCGIIFLLTTNKSQIIPFLGSALTPFLLLFLLAIIVAGIWYGQTVEPFDSNYWPAFREGALQGYQTMDLLAAFFFSTFVIKHLSNHFSATSDNSQLVKVFIKSALLGGGLLAIVYCGLVYLGATFASDLKGIAPQMLLGIISQKTLGALSAPVVCSAVILACFTTAVVLTSLFADFFKQQVCRESIHSSLSLLLTLLIAFGVSTREFSGIATFLAPILETLYPALIVLTLINIAHKLGSIKLRRWPVILTFAMKLYFLIE